MFIYFSFKWYMFQLYVAIITNLNMQNKKALQALMTTFPSKHKELPQRFTRMSALPVQHMSTEARQQRLSSALIEHVITCISYGNRRGCIETMKMWLMEAKF
jgi:hypothetical protein